jgi:hypothetical protein
MSRISKKTKLANRKKWLKALRSGKYKQTTRTLATDERGTPCAPNEGHRFCCLGVAAKVCKFKEAKATGGSLGNSLRLLGLSPNDETALINLNDREGRRFKTIAKHIEKLPIASVV